MLKFYGTMICPDCVRAREELNAAGVEFEYIDITASTLNLKEFLNLRDTKPEFDRVKERGNIGIPCLVREDGSIVFRADKVIATA